MSWCLPGRFAGVTSCGGGVLLVCAFLVCFGFMVLHIGFWEFVEFLSVWCLGYFGAIVDFVTGGCNCAMVCFAEYLRVGGLGCWHVCRFWFGWDLLFGVCVVCVLLRFWIWSLGCMVRCLVRFRGLVDFWFSILGHAVGGWGLRILEFGCSDVCCLWAGSLVSWFGARMMVFWIVL